MRIEDLYSIFTSSSGISTDSRNVSKDNLFFALKGPSFNGNKYAYDALDRGAKYAVIDEKEYETDRCILVEDVLSTLQKLSAFHRGKFSIPIIAITGSNGKTTTKELIYAILSRKYEILKTEGNFNNHIGVPITLLKLKPHHEMAIIEMGANHQGEIRSYCDWVQPNYGIITNVAKAHLEGFGSLEGVVQAKGELYDHLKGKGLVFVPSDQKRLMEKSADQSRITYGELQSDYLRVTELEEGINVTLEYSCNGVDRKVSSGLYGSYNLYNIAASICIGKYFEVDDENIRSALEKFRSENNRSQFIERKGNRIVLDAYNANPSSMKAAIEQFASVKSSHKVLILGDMFELGKYSMEEHKAIIELVRDLDLKEVTYVGEHFYPIASKEGVRTFKTTSELLKWLESEKIVNADILIKGSRSMKLEEAVEFLD
ncbi:MAG: UDP-N-acetylmuramoyl-tripeptide--D-alanyl-D-alanine ligase [Chitinophagales bacterium]|nr:UDP-N-acetylmuramoyl-tripeptide--D-alanyl-D-alanine ligase [Chitinophagales bacterium]